MSNQEQNIPDSETMTFYHQVRAIPMLAKGEDAQLGRAWRDYEDIDARNKLVEAHMRFGLSQARQYNGYGLSEQDIRQLAFEGLLKAAVKYDPDKVEGKELRFATYAVHWIRASINEHAMKQHSVVKIGTLAAHKTLFFSLRKAMQVIQQRYQVMDTPQYEDKHWQALTDEINDSDRKLTVSVAEVKHMAGRLSGGDASLSVPVNDDGATMTFQDTIEDDSLQAADAYEKQDEADVCRSILLEAFGSLNEREKDIVIQRRLLDDPKILEDLGTQYDVSKERIRQIEVKGMEKLRKAFHRIASGKLGAFHPMVTKIAAAMKNDPNFKLKI